MTSNGSSRYDVIVIGGGHNGLVNAAYLARAGKKVLVLERRHLVGGAAVTEEIIPGFKFSVCSYVVSLLRPEIIRDLDLPRHGLEILPLDGTFTPMPNGDYLWRVNDHGKTMRELRRHSRFDAEAYEEFGKAMLQMCRFVKPILSMVPPDPTTLNPKDLFKLLFLGRRFQDLSGEDKYNQVQLMTMSAIDFLDQWFETDVLKATMSASGIIGTFLGVRSPGTAYVLLHHYMGEIDARGALSARVVFPGQIPGRCGVVEFPGLFGTGRSARRGVLQARRLAPRPHAPGAGQAAEFRLSRIAYSKRCTFGRRIRRRRFLFRSTRHANAYTGPRRPHCFGPRSRLHGHERVLRRARRPRVARDPQARARCRRELPRHRGHVRPVHQRGTGRPRRARPPRRCLPRHQVRLRARGAQSQRAGDRRAPGAGARWPAKAV